MKRQEFASLTYIGSTAVFKELLDKVGKATAQGNFNSYPRVVGETGGKNFHLVHASADIRRSAALNTIRAAFEYQGQKCSACSGAYVAESVWPEFRRILIEETLKLKIGAPEQFDNFINPVIHDRAFARLSKTFKDAEKDAKFQLLVGGKIDGSKGYFVHLAVYQTIDAQHEIMEKELFRPLLAIYVYPGTEFDNIVSLIDSTSPYALTGSIFAKDPVATDKAQIGLRNAAGNLYINTKRTGSVVGQQPFGGSRDSGTNDKTGSLNMLSRWVSVQSIKEEYDLLDTVTYPSNEA